MRSDVTIRVFIAATAVTVIMPEKTSDQNPAIAQGSHQEPVGL